MGFLCFSCKKNKNLFLFIKIKKLGFFLTLLLGRRMWPRLQKKLHGPKPKAVHKVQRIQKPTGKRRMHNRL